MAPTFIQVLTQEVAKLETAHPERAADLAKAQALILQGQVLPSADNPQIGHVLSSDGETRYSVNGSCDCPAGVHGKPCKHFQSWRLYQHIARKLDAQTAQEGASSAGVTPDMSSTLSALGEAPASINVRLTIDGRDCQLTLRDTDEHRLLQRLQTVLAQYPVEPKPQAAGPTAQLSPQQHNAAAMHRPVSGFCAVHNCQMTLNQKDGRSWYSHQVDGQWCKGKGVRT